MICFSLSEKKIKIKILISIVSWNFSERLNVEIPRILNCLDENDQILVYETGNKHIFPKVEHKQVNYFHISENLGFAKTHEYSIKYMEENGFDGTLILNPDINIPNNLIQNLKKTIRERNNQEVLGAPIFNLKKGQLELEYAGFPIDEQVRTKMQLAKLSQSGDIEMEPIDYLVQDIHGAFMYIPQPISKKYGWMKEDYFLYGEENEYLWRLNEYQVPIRVFSSLAILHDNGGTFQWNSDLLNIREYYKTRNRLYNNRLFFGRRSYLNINYTFLLKYFFGKDIFRMNRFRNKDVNYFNYLGHLHFFRGIRGKVFDPNNYL